jgi:acetyl esterase
MASTNTVKLPGQLGTPNMQMKDDPRADPRMLAALAPFHLDGPPPASGVDANSDIDALYAYCDAAEAGFEMFNNAVFSGLEPVPGVSSRTEIIKGVDGNDIALYIHQPDNANGPLPCVVHTHGGGMVFLKGSMPGYIRWRDELAATGMVVVGVEFRNGGGALGNHPFPAGLNDCASGVQWVDQNRTALGVSKIIVSGESGGGNLCLATALKANQEGWMSKIDGIYAQCPYISNAWTEKSTDLPSLFENDNYLINVESMGALAKVYDPKREHNQNPLCWPYVASASDLAGLPPHVISVNELDPLRDEGLAFFHKLVGAGVKAASRTVNGSCHAGDCLLRTAMPEAYLSTIRDIKGFADSL